MRSRLFAWFLTVVLMIAAYVFIIRTLSDTNSKQRTVIHGTIDLSHWNFDKHVVTLSGEWTFYPNQLIDPSDILSKRNLHTIPIAVPGFWNLIQSSIHSGTYRLEVKIANPNPIYALKIQSAQMASKVYVDHSLVASSGVPANDSSYVAHNQPYTAFFKLKKGMNQILIQVVNRENTVGGGITQIVYLGYAQQIASLDRKSLLHDAVSVTLFLSLGLYLIRLFNRRQRNFGTLAFGVLCLMAGTFSSVNDAKIIWDIFPNLSNWALIRIQIVSASIAGIMMFLYMYFEARDHAIKWVTKGGSLFGLVLIICQLTITGDPWAKTITPATAIYVILALAYSTSVLARATIARVPGILYVLLAWIALCFYILTNNLSIYFAVPVYTLPPIDSLIFVLVFSSLIALRFANIFQQNERMTIDLQKADKIKDEFISKTAHEFKTPLHGIISISESVLEDEITALKDEQKEKISLISNLARRLSHLVYDILDYTNLEQGTLKLDLSTVDLYSMVEVILRVYSFIAHDSVALINNVPRDLPMVVADEGRIRQVISNLLDNAIKYTPSGSIEISAETNGETIRVSVVDSGIGIDTKHLSTIFEPFRSIDKISDDSFGLGLSIVKQIVELHDGQIWVESMKGRGSQFTFSLPMAKTGGSMKSHGRTTSRERAKSLNPTYSFPVPYVTPGTGTHTILAVDDHFPNLKVLIESLESLNYTVIAVNSGDQALTYLKDHAGIDLVVLDLMMPGISGLEVCRAIRQTYSLLEIPIIIVTASIHADDKIAAFAAGANDYLPKPFDSDELKARVQSLLLMKEFAQRSLDMEVAFLQSQIQPHFLFNVLNTIVALSYRDNAEARKLTIHFAEYLRGSFASINIQHQIPFEREFALVQSYVEIEKVRFKDRVRVIYDIAPSALKVMIPPLLVQPIVENSIRHGITQRTEGGTVTIRAQVEGNWAVFEISDNGVGMARTQVDELLSSDTSVSGQEGVGLRNVNRRLKYMSNTGLTIISAPDQGTTVKFQIPVAHP